ncbi:MAG: sugar phosphate isomerase/epimerase family protein [Spirochaetia bacterium]|jgi:D-psicose/D-tagatose/L-ribulose 3-epimerase
MNKVGIFYAFWCRNWETDFIPIAIKAKKLGFDILELHSGVVVQMQKAEQDRLVGEAKSHGIELTFVTALSPQHDIASPDHRVRKTGIDNLKEQVRVIKYMGGNGLSGVLYGSWNASLPENESDKRMALERSIASMREVMKAAEDNDVTFNLEVVNRFEQFLINTAEEAVDYVDRVQSTHCKILLDTFHMNIEEDSYLQAITAVGERLGHFHLGQSNRRPPEAGKIPWDEIIGILCRTGYQGPLVMEPFVMPSGAVGRDVRLYRDLRAGADLDDLAQKACAFVREKLSFHSKKA